MLQLQPRLVAGAWRCPREACEQERIAFKSAVRPDGARFIKLICRAFDPMAAVQVRGNSQTTWERYGNSARRV